jgi:hypothetical protein
VYCRERLQYRHLSKLQAISWTDESHELFQRFLTFDLLNCGQQYIVHDVQSISCPSKEV